MMALPLINPFQDMILAEHFCFLSGDLAPDNITVFSEWLMEKFEFGKEEIALMQNTKAKMTAYQDLKLPCSLRVKEAFEELDNKFKKAFDEGFEAINQLDELIIFQWSARIVYGLLYLEMMGEW